MLEGLVKRNPVCTSGNLIHHQFLQGLKRCFDLTHQLGWCLVLCKFLFVGLKADEGRVRRQQSEEQLGGKIVNPTGTDATERCLKAAVWSEALLRHNIRKSELGTGPTSVKVRIPCAFQGR